MELIFLCLDSPEVSGGRDTGHLGLQDVQPCSVAADLPCALLDVGPRALCSPLASLSAPDYAHHACALVPSVAFRATPRLTITLPTSLGAQTPSHYTLLRQVSRCTMGTSGHLPCCAWAQCLACPGPQSPHL